MFEQDRVLVRLQQRVNSERNILVCFLSGSFGRGNQDEFSDLNVVLVFADQSTREDAYSQRRQFVQSVLPYVPAKSFDASHVRPYFHIALYANGAKVDFLYESMESYQPTPYDWDMRILKDTADWGKQFLTAATQLPPSVSRERISKQALIDLDERFWVMFMDIYRQVIRGDSEKPFPIYLQLLYFTFPRLLALLPVDSPASKTLIEASYGLDSSATARHLRGLLNAYLEARDSVANYHEIVFPVQLSLERQILNLVNKRIS